MNARLKESMITCPSGLKLKQILAVGLMVFLAVSARAQTISPSNLPLYFEANQSQTEFLSRGSGYQILISAEGAQIALRHKSAVGMATAQMKFAGANPEAIISGGGELTGKINYFVGNDPSQWQTGLPTFSQIQIAGIYPGINVVYHGNQRQLEYDFDVAAGANPADIKMRFDGMDKISIAADGGLILKIGDSEIVQPKPEIYQTVAGRRQVIRGGYKILDARTVVFDLGTYDHSLPLVIDPVLSYSAFFGSNNIDVGWSLARDPSGNLYIAGQTSSKQFFTSGAFQTNYNGGVYIGDAFVAKFGNPATNLIYLTYLGGSGDDAAYSVAADQNGNAYVAGATESANFPITNAIPGGATIGGKIVAGIYLADAFVTELNPSGSNLVYSTFLGGSSADAAYAIALDSSNNAYVTGFTYSTNFPVGTNVLQKTFGGTNTTTFLNANAFVSEITNGGGALVYSTYLGGTNYDVGRAIAVDSSNNVYVAGYTASYNFPTWNVPTNVPTLGHLNGYTNQASILSFYDGFATKFPPLATHPAAITNLIYSTFLGGSNSDMAYGIAADAVGNAYVAGWTSSTNFPVVNMPADLFSFVITNGINFFPVATNVFLTKIAANGSAILDSAVFGGNAVDIGYGVAVDPAGDAFVVGSETSAATNFPTLNTFGSLLATNSTITGGHNVFVTAFSADWSTNYYSVLMGGNLDSYGYGIALDASTNVYITGMTSANNFPTLNASQYFFNGTNVINGTNNISGLNFTGTTDVFLAEITFTPTIPVLGIEPTNLTVGLGATATFSVSVSGTTQQILFQWQNNGTNLVNGGESDGGAIFGATSSTLVISNAQPADSSTNYSVIVSYAGGSVDFSNVVLTVLDTPFITVGPTNVSVPIGGTAIFTMSANGNPMAIAWSTNGGNTVLTNGGNIFGATNTTLIITNVQPADAGTYTVFAYNPFDLGLNNSSNAILTVLGPTVTNIVSINRNPTNGIVFSGNGGTLGGTYHIVVATNLLTPLSEWTPIATNNFDSHGQFIFTNPVNTSLPAEFFILEPQ